MKTVYRVEHYDYRHGPYTAGGVKTKKAQKCATKLGNEFDYDLQPPPSLDGLSYPEEDDYCGFDSLEKLFSWFEKWLDELEEAGYVIAEFHVPSSDVKLGLKQVLFPRKQHKRYRTYPLKATHDNQ